jgi:membrane protein implicated in regulation of membrane protease activity
MGVFLKMNTAMETAFLFLISFGFAVVPTAFEIWLFAKLKGLEEISEKNPAEAIGKIGKVYLTIPENGIGEIEIAFGGGLRIWKAKSLNGNRIESFSQIKVEQFDGSILIVSKV